MKQDKRSPQSAHATSDEARVGMHTTGHDLSYREEVANTEKLKQRHDITRLRNAVRVRRREIWGVGHGESSPSGAVDQKDRP